MAKASKPTQTQPSNLRPLFEREVCRLMDRLYGTALQLTRHPDDAEDIVAEAVSKAWEKLHQLQEPERIEGWLFRILNHTFINHWRRRRCRQDRETNLDGEDAEGETFSLFEKLHQPFLLWWGTPEHTFINNLLQEDIQKALDRLPDDFRVTVVLVDMEGYSYDEAARWLGVAKGTVRSRLNRARNQLQKTLWQQGRDAGLSACQQKAQPTERGGQ